MNVCFSFGHGRCSTTADLEEEDNDPVQRVQEIPEQTLESTDADSSSPKPMSVATSSELLDLEVIPESVLCPFVA